MTTKYSEDHEWVKVDGDLATIGITDHAQDSLGDIVFIELPDVGDSHDQGDAIGVVESVKAAADIYMPVSGEVTEVNESLQDDPSLANSDPTGDGWLLKIKLSDTSELDDLMDEDAYNEFIED